MLEIIEKLPREQLLSELTEDKLLRKTNYGNNEIYVINHNNSPYLMQEIGRLREIAFREAGGGTGKSIDIDKFDTKDVPYEQLIVWDPDSLEILGGYRFLHLRKLSPEKFIENTATSKLFNISEDFIRDYAPYTIELGRSFIQPSYQVTQGKSKSIYILDNLWDGLGALTKAYDDVRYFFGKITMYTHFHTKARDLILYFFNKYFKGDDKLLFPKDEVLIVTSKNELDKVFVGSDYRADYKILSASVRALNEKIPPLFNAYMKLSPTMKVFGTAINNNFGGVEETGILITIKDIYESKKNRHL